MDLQKWAHIVNNTCTCQINYKVSTANDSYTTGGV
jgi:hypothetical protein